MEKHEKTRTNVLIFGGNNLKEIVYSDVVPKGIVLEFEHSLLVGTGNPKGDDQHEGLLSQERE